MFSVDSGRAKLKAASTFADNRIQMTLAALTEMNKQANSDIQLSATLTDTSKFGDAAKSANGNRPAFDLKATYTKATKRVTSFGTGVSNVIHSHCI